jgi:hypothetical protein
MNRFVVETNVPIVANGRPDREGKIPSIDCRIAAVRFLQELLKSGKILIDLAGEIQAEYRKHLNPNGQPAVGDRFYQAVLNSAPHLIERIELPKRYDGEYDDLPQALIDVNFDPSDRKFAALARRERAPVINATDSDWLKDRAILDANGINVEFLCGCDRTKWFMKSTADT